MALAALVAPASAQTGEGDPGSTTTTSRPPATLLPPLPPILPGATSTTTTTTRPAPTSGPTTPSTAATTTTIFSPPQPGTSPHADPVGAGEAPSDTVPGADVVVPPPPVAATPPVGTARLTAVVVREQAQARVGLARARATYEAAISRVGRLRARRRALDARIARLRSADRRAVERFAHSEEDLAEQAADAYIRAFGEDEPASALLDSSTATDYGRRRRYLDSMLDAFRRTVQANRDARREVRGALVELGEERADVVLALRAATAAVPPIRLGVLTAGMVHEVFDAGSEIVTGETGFVFPVADPHSFIDSYGAPRMMGTRYAHFHEGTDIMAPSGTPLFACERGVITEMRSSTLGGTSLWRKGGSGTLYYYAHLSAYAKDVAVGQLVEVGTVLGYVGNTGNARFTAPHLHFEVHPDGGEAVNPYPLLRVVDDAVKGRARPGG